MLLTSNPLANWTRIPMENKGWAEQVLIKVIRINKQCDICNNITNSEEKPKWHPMHSPYKVKTKKVRKKLVNMNLKASLPVKTQLKGQKLSLQCVGTGLKLEHWTRCYSFIIIKYLHAFQKFFLDNYFRHFFL